jgi:glycosyltransferase involved in cell wall biosynthesis
VTRLAWVVDGGLDQLSGGYLYDRIVVDHLRTRGVDVHVLSLPTGPYGLRLVQGIPHAVEQRLLNSGFDLVVQDELSHPALLRATRRLANEAPVLRRVALVHHLRASEPRARPANRIYRQIEAAYLESVDAFVFNSRTTRAVVHALVGSSRPSVVALPGADRLGTVLDPETVERRAVEPGPLRILFVANVIPRKGLHTLVEAIALLPRGMTTLTVAGNDRLNPAYSRRVSATVRKFGLEDQISFTGALESPALTQAMSTHHVLAVPSAYEGYGMAYLEGMGHALPAIAGVDGGAREFVQDDENGYLVRPGDPAGVATRLLALANDRQQLLRLSLSALGTYRDHPKWSDTGDSVLRFLGALVSQAETSA